MKYAIVSHHTNDTVSSEYISQDIPNNSDCLMSCYTDQEGNIYIEYATQKNDRNPLHPYDTLHRFICNPLADGVNLITLHRLDDYSHSIVSDIVKVIFSEREKCTAVENVSILSPVQFKKVTDTGLYQRFVYSNTDTQRPTNANISVTFFEINTSLLPYGALEFVDDSEFRSSVLSIGNINHIEVHQKEDGAQCDIYTVVCDDMSRYKLACYF